MFTFRRILQTSIFPPIVVTFILTVFCAAASVFQVQAANDRFTVTDKKLVDNLVKQWAPLVWLAPGEQFLPLDVNEFLDNVHIHHDQISDQQIENEIQWESRHPISSRIMYSEHSKEEQPEGEDRKPRMPNGFPAVDALPRHMTLGEFSKKSYLVTNEHIDNLLQNNSSFLFGKDPNKFEVPVYAVVNICSGVKAATKEKEDDQNTIIKYPPYRQHFIPISPADNNIRSSEMPAPSRANKTYYTNVRRKRDTISESTTESAPKEIVSEFMANVADNVKFSFGDDIDERIQANQVDYEKTMSKVPSFHVTYWMFYPYSQGKTMCTMSLGPLGRVPIPLIFGMCMGSRKDFGSHVGDWEHMSLFFKGAAHPEAMYVSAHDAGAYYSYNQLTETFEFRSQETRKGILQRPNFPKTVITSSDHPVLFAALGSHGLWTAPGKHRFVRVPRLYDVNGFGTPWYTWKIVDVAYENLRSQRSIPPKWFQFKGKWGNPKSKCHPLRRIGLNFCEYSDGPTGIPLKPAHFQCSI